MQSVDPPPVHGEGEPLGERPDPQLAYSDTTSLTYRMLAGDPQAAHHFLLLHGYGGDEKVMWVMFSALALKGTAVAPRGLFPAAQGGFSWVESPRPDLSTLDDFQASAEALAELIMGLETKGKLDPARLVIMGFSQGAALAFALLNAGGIRPAAVASLAGFVPEGRIGDLAGNRIYWAHGVDDDRVSIRRAQADVRRLEAQGAEITFCEDEVGHKVGAVCMRGLKSWLLETPNSQPSA